MPRKVLQTLCWRKSPCFMSTRPSNFMILVRHLDLKFLNELAAIMIGTSNPPHWSVPRLDAQTVAEGAAPVVLAASP